jgi:predicted protein tyrosine phosphatase
MKVSRNKLSVIKNKYQTDAPRVLCVCSGGVLRSPTAAWILSNPPFNFNTRSCGDADYALIPLTAELVTWADEIVCMDAYHSKSAQLMLDGCTDKDDSLPLIHVLDIEDDYDYRNAELVEMMTNKFKDIFSSDID